MHMSSMWCCYLLLLLLQAGGLQKLRSLKFTAADGTTATVDAKKLNRRQSKLVLDRCVGTYVCVRASVGRKAEGGVRHLLSDV